MGVRAQTAWADGNLRRHLRSQCTTVICARPSSCAKRCGWQKCVSCPPAIRRTANRRRPLPKCAWRWCARPSPIEPGFTVDDRETRRSGLSYSVDTLAELRAEFPHRSICLLLGMDAFLGLPNWHRWREILELAHVVVAHRPGWKAPTQGPLGEAMVDRGTGSVRDLHDATAGRIFVHAVTQLEISSTELRQLIARGRDPRYLVPDSVCRLLRETGWYAQRQ